VRVRRFSFIEFWENNCKGCTQYRPRYQELGDKSICRHNIDWPRGKPEVCFCGVSVGVAQTGLDRFEHRRTCPLHGRQNIVGSGYHQDGTVYEKGWRDSRWVERLACGCHVSVDSGWWYGEIQTVNLLTPSYCETWDIEVYPEKVIINSYLCRRSRSPARRS
jgi:hypothetical protein